MDLAGAINVVVLTIQAHAGHAARSQSIDFNFRTTNPR
jgi:hypothetical protein